MAGPILFRLSGAPVGERRPAAAAGRRRLDGAPDWSLRMKAVESRLEEAEAGTAGLDRGHVRARAAPAGGFRRGAGASARAEAQRLPAFAPSGARGAEPLPARPSGGAGGLAERRARRRRRQKFRRTARRLWRPDFGSPVSTALRPRRGRRADNRASWGWMFVSLGASAKNTGDAKGELRAYDAKGVAARRRRLRFWRAGSPPRRNSTCRSSCAMTWRGWKFWAKIPQAPFSCSISGRGGGASASSPARGPEQPLPLAFCITCATRCWPFADLRQPKPGDADPVRPSAQSRTGVDVLILADVNVVEPGTAGRRLDAFLASAAHVLRFAGPRLAARRR